MTDIDVSNLGFTGTRVGMTDKQKEMLALFFSDHPEGWFSHGECIGADEEAHLLVREFSNRKIKVFPPDIDYLRASISDADIVMPAAPYLTRNRRIVDASSLLIACPAKEQEEQRSGTWSTVRYAKKRKVPVLVIYPSGRIEILS